MAIGTCVLVHGGWHGGWHWDDVAARLRAAGIRVFAPTLRGLAERAAEATDTTCLADHVDDVVQVLDQHDLTDVVLAGHSYGGAVITGAAHKRPGRVKHLVYLDAFVPRHGESLGDIFGPAFAANAREQALAAGTPHLVPPAFSMEDVLGVDTEEAAAHAARLSPHPLGTMLDPVDANGPLAVARSFIYCAANPLGMFESYARQARESADWQYFELPSPHDAVYAMPAAISGILEHLTNGKRTPPAEAERAGPLAADRAFFDALLAGDVGALESLLAPDFVIVDVVAGAVTDRTTFLAGITSGEVQFDEIDTAPDEALVRLYGGVAIVVGRTEMRVSVPGSEPMTIRSRYTHAFRRGGPSGWLLVSAQGTQIG